MNLSRSLFKSVAMAAGAGLVALVAGCGGGLDPILGSPGVGQVPTVTATSPAASSPFVTAVDTHASVTATFSKPLKPASVNATSFSLACPSGTPVAATVSYDDASSVARLTPDAALPPNTTCVATLSTEISDTSGLTLGSAFVWSFVTGVASAADTTMPTVSFVTPSTGASGVATNSRISATFSEAMNPATISGTSLLVTNTTLGTPVAGTVSYAAASRTAVFTPTSPATLASDTAYSVTVTTAATDLAGNALAGNMAVAPSAGNEVWTFTTGAAADVTAPTATAISPAAGSTLVCLSHAVSVTFSEAMDATTINAASFGVTDGGIAVAGSVSYDAASRVAVFTPSDPNGFVASHSFVVTVSSGSAGVADLAGNPLAADRSWGFTTGSQACLGPVDLGTAASFGAFGGSAGVTNQGLHTVIGGNVGTTAACTLVTGLHDAANGYTQTPLNVGGVNGSINCGPPAPGTTTTLAIATQARTDALAAYNALAALPSGSDPGAGELGGLVLAPGVYTAAGGTFAVTGGDLTLDAQGDANAVWVFQSAAALTVGQTATPRHVLLVNGAQAKNVFWQVGSAARIEDGSVMVGTIIAPAGVTVSTPGETAQTVLTGRAIGLTASVTLVNTSIVAP